MPDHHAPKPNTPPDDSDDLPPLSSRPHVQRPQKRVSFRVSARLCDRCATEARRRGFSSLAQWCRTMMWQMVSEVDDETPASEG